ncbi:hypothetical protein [Paramicrobacterium chengjingii]|uniref:hypothetical protein n=1 Tax=Paramicrobacterium chengjingii TaxID=2769067 RepID=UPI001423F842|nr:hypothetical protein [Microbacterium chengjingii]
MSVMTPWFSELFAENLHTLGDDWWLNYNVVDEIGHWVKCVDLAYPEWRIAIEYQSAYHREAEQFARDVTALTELTRVGWYTVQLTSKHVFAYPRLTASTVKEAIDAQKQRPLHAPTRPELPKLPELPELPA